MNYNFCQRNPSWMLFVQCKPTVFVDVRYPQSKLSRYFWCFSSVCEWKTFCNYFHFFINCRMCLFVTVC